MLLRQDGRRHEHGDLPPALDGLEGSTDGDFSFAETDIATDESVHRPRALHVGLRIVDGFELVAGFGEGKRGLEFLLPCGVFGERVAWLRLPCGVDAEQFGGEIDRCAFGGLAGFFPAP